MAVEKKKRTLWEISSELETYLHEHTNEDGEFSEGFEEGLEKLEIEREKKILAVGLFAKGEKLEGDAIAGAAKAFKAEYDARMRRANAHYGRLASLKQYLAQVLEQGEKFADENCRVRTQTNSTSSIRFDEDVYDLDQWAKDFPDFVVTREDPDFEALRQAAKDKEDLPPGVEVRTGYHVRIE